MVFNSVCGIFMHQIFLALNCIFITLQGPHIAKVTLAAWECRSLDFPEPPYPDEYKSLIFCIHSLLLLVFYFNSKTSNSLKSSHRFPRYLHYWKEYYAKLVNFDKLYTVTKEEIKRGAIIAERILDREWRMYGKNMWHEALKVKIKIRISWSFFTS